MSRPDYLRQIRKRVNAAAPGSVFIPSDFADIAEAVKVNMCLNRLIDSGELQRASRGVFVKPRHSTLLGKRIPARSDDIANAIARKHGWTIIPCGDTALNALGLSTQLPVVWKYISDGPYKEHQVDGLALKFKHTDRKSEIVGLSYETALVIQALRAVGKDNITDAVIATLSGKLNKTAKKKMLAEGRTATAWIYECIKRICAEDTK